MQLPKSPFSAHIVADCPFWDGRRGCAEGQYASVGTDGRVIFREIVTIDVIGPRAWRKGFFGTQVLIMKKLRANEGGSGGGRIGRPPGSGPDFQGVLLEHRN